MNLTGLSRAGFTLIRNLLDGRVAGGPEAARDLAEALHNLPEVGNEFLVELTIDNITRFMETYPELSEYLEPDVAIFCNESSSSRQQPET